MFRLTALNMHTREYFDRNDYDQGYMDFDTKTTNLDRLGSWLRFFEMMGFKHVTIA